ncbi:unnamed protein product [Owenia fusiformis]|uniref:Uncharacterized protein n=1 Tax=Owenia fusiformis TaxID=6347 RepID=A0A8J1XTD4_OWEFU|nr:unnamed protein product [Owenia fusiformis]
MSTEAEIQLPLKSVVLFIACGALFFLLVFLFVKRQISRFTLRSAKVPYIGLGTGAPKSLKNEIERRLNRIPNICFEPKAFSHKLEESLQDDIKNGRCTYIYRMKAVDAIAFLDEELSECEPEVKRNLSVTLKEALLELKLKNTGPLHGAKFETIEALSSCYNHARYGVEEFGLNNYKRFMDLLSEIIFCIRSHSETSANGDHEVPTQVPVTHLQHIHDIDNDNVIAGPRISGKSAESINLIDIDGDKQVRFLHNRGSLKQGFQRLRSSSSSNSSLSSQESRRQDESTV